MRHAALLKKRLSHWYFPLNFCEIFKSTFFAEQMPLYQPIDILTKKLFKNLKTLAEADLGLLQHPRWSAL